MTESSSVPTTPTAGDPPVLELQLCQTCQAACGKGQAKCWLCGANPEQPNPYGSVPVSSGAAEPAAGQLHIEKYDSVFMVLLVVCTLLAILVGIGLAVEDQGALIGYLILVGPAFAVTGVRGLWQMGRYGRTSGKKLFLSMVLSFALTIAVLALLVMAGIAFLFIMCLSAFSQ